MQDASIEAKNESPPSAVRSDANDFRNASENPNGRACPRAILVHVPVQDPGRRHYGFAGDAVANTNAGFSYLRFHTRVWFCVLMPCGSGRKTVSAPARSARPPPRERGGRARERSRGRRLQRRTMLCARPARRAIFHHPRGRPPPSPDVARNLEHDVMNFALWAKGSARLAVNGLR